LLNKERIAHQVLNAKFHEKEAHIIAHAGRPGSITVATNMAGRGTDIVLGGSLDEQLRSMEEVTEAERQQVRDDWKVRHDAVVSSGGLHIIGTERHESRRIDNQLRGRSGRQGDPGSSRFYLSLDDNLMRIFASERVAAIMQKLGMEEGEAIEHPWVTKAIENAQRKVEGRNFDIRKQLLEFDDVANDQRKVVYEQRNELMDAEDVEENIQGIRHDVVNEVLDEYVPQGSFEEQWNVSGLAQCLEGDFGLKLDLATWLEQDESLHDESLRARVLDEVTQAYEQKEAIVGAAVMRRFEKAVMLQVLDSHWKEHLAAMDYLRQGIHLRGYAQKNPKQEYKREAFEMFGEFLENVKKDVIRIISLTPVQEPDDVEAVERQRRQQADMEYQHAQAANHLSEQPQPDGPEEQPSKTPFVRAERKVGRNEPCPCGSGKKYKQCHGKLA